MAAWLLCTNLYGQRFESLLIWVLAGGLMILLESERMEACKELLWGHLLLTFLSPLGGCHETVSPGLWVLMRCGAFYPIPFRTVSEYKPIVFGFSTVVCPTDLSAIIHPLFFQYLFFFFLVCGTRIAGNWHLWLNFLFIVYVSSKLSRSVNGSLYLHRLNQSSLGLGLANLVCLLDSNRICKSSTLCLKEEHEMPWGIKKKSKGIETTKWYRYFG